MDLSWLNNLFLAAAVTAILFGAWRWLGGASSSPIDQAALDRAVAEGAPLIDVRTPGEFASGHLPGARNLPLSELPHKLRTLGAKSQPILVYCRSGSRSGSAKRHLERAGFETVIDLGSLSHARRALAASRSSQLAAQGAR